MPPTVAERPYACAGEQPRWRQVVAAVPRAPSPPAHRPVARDAGRPDRRGGRLPGARFLRERAETPDADASRRAGVAPPPAEARDTCATAVQTAPCAGPARMRQADADAHVPLVTRGGGRAGGGKPGTIRWWRRGGAIEAERTAPTDRHRAPKTSPERPVSATIRAGGARAQQVSARNHRRGRPADRHTYDQWESHGVLRRTARAHRRRVGSERHGARRCGDPDRPGRPGPGGLGRRGHGARSASSRRTPGSASSASTARRIRASTSRTPPPPPAAPTARSCSPTNCSAAIRTRAGRPRRPSTWTARRTVSRTRTTTPTRDSADADEPGGRRGAAAGPRRRRRDSLATTSGWQEIAAPWARRG